MSTSFTRTPGGLMVKWRFHPQPTIWVEGRTDIFFYSPAVTGMDCRLEAFHGDANKSALIEGLTKNDYPYLVILDGDYGILDQRRSPHKNLIRLSRYSFENYLWEERSVNRICLRHAQYGDNDERLAQEMQKLRHAIAQVLFQAVVLDAAARRMNPAPQVLPKHIEPLLQRQNQFHIDQSKVELMLKKAATMVHPNYVREEEAKISKFTSERCFTHLLKGHLLFGILRIVFFQIATELRGSPCIVKDDALLQMLSEAVWQDLPSEDHKRLRSNIRRKVKALSAIRQQSAISSN